MAQCIRLQKLPLKKLFVNMGEFYLWHLEGLVKLMSRYIPAAFVIAIMDDKVKLYRPASILDCLPRSHPHFSAKASCERQSDWRRRVICRPRSSWASINCFSKRSILRLFVETEAVPMMGTPKFIDDMDNVVMDFFAGDVCSNQLGSRNHGQPRSSSERRLPIVISTYVAFRM